jgi:hypothetical protein
VDWIQLASDQDQKRQAVVNIIMNFCSIKCLELLAYFPTHFSRRTQVHGASSKSGVIRWTRKAYEFWARNKNEVTLKTWVKKTPWPESASELY